MASVASGRVRLVAEEGGQLTHRLRERSGLSKERQRSILDEEDFPQGLRAHLPQRLYQLHEDELLQRRHHVRENPASALLLVYRLVQAQRVDEIDRASALGAGIFVRGLGRQHDVRAAAAGVGAARYPPRLLALA